MSRLKLPYLFFWLNELSNWESKMFKMFECIRVEHNSFLMLKAMWKWVNRWFRKMWWWRSWRLFEWLLWKLAWLYLCRGNSHFAKLMHYTTIHHRSSLVSITIYLNYKGYKLCNNLNIMLVILIQPIKLWPSDVHLCQRQPTSKNSFFYWEHI